jgi:polysaccharide export outer membrane protein
MGGIDASHLARIEKIKASQKDRDTRLDRVIQETPNYSVKEYLNRNPGANNPASRDFEIGGYDILDIKVYEEPDLTREGIPVSSEGYISFPLIGRIEVSGLSTSEIEELISNRLAEGQYLLDAHVSVTLRENRSKGFMVLGAVDTPGSYPLRGRERVLDAISRAGGIDAEEAGKEAVIIRTKETAADEEEKISIRVDLARLLQGGDPESNLLLYDKDLLYIPKAENYYIIGQVQKPGSYPYKDKEITLVEAISRAGGFTVLASRNRTRIVRLEGGLEKIIEVQVDAITESGRKGQDVAIHPGDVIVVPESLF